MDAVQDNVSMVYEAFQGQGFVGVTLCDLSRAFATVDHEILLAKLEFYGIKNVKLDLFSSYLSEQEQAVQIDRKELALSLRAQLWVQYCSW